MPDKAVVDESKQSIRRFFHFPLVYPVLSAAILRPYPRNCHPLNPPIRNVFNWIFFPRGCLCTLARKLSGSRLTLIRVLDRIRNASFLRFITITIAISFDVPPRSSMLFRQFNILRRGGVAKRICILNFRRKIFMKALAEIVASCCSAGRICRFIFLFAKRISFGCEISQWIFLFYGFLEIFRKCIKIYYRPARSERKEKKKKIQLSRLR